MLSSSLRHRDMFYVLNRGHIGLRNLDLHLICDSRLWISPILRRDETARGCGRKELSPNTPGCNPQLSGAFPVYGDVYARIIERFVILKVAERANLGYFRANLLGKGAIGTEVRSAHIDFHGRRSAEVHDLRHDVSSFKRKLAARKLVRQELPQPFLEFVHANVGVRLQGHTQYRLMLTASPKVDRVNGIVRRWRANVAQGHTDIARTGRFLNEVEHTKRESFRGFHTCPDGRSEPQQKLTGSDPREDLSSEIRAEQDNHQNGSENVRRDRKSPYCREPVQNAAERVPHSVEHGSRILRFRCMPAQNPR